jgi:hypothetical protein
MHEPQEEVSTLAHEEDTLLHRSYIITALYERVCQAPSAIATSFIGLYFVSEVGAFTLQFPWQPMILGCVFCVR